MMEDRGSTDGAAMALLQHLIAFAILYLLFSILVTSPLRAQVPDSTGAATPDSVAAPALTPVGFSGPEPGVAVTDTVLALSAAPDVAGMLAAVPGAFVYELGAFGWPDGWSPYGLNPQQIGLLLNGLPFDDPVTGRPRYDLLPMAFLEPLTMQASRLGRPLALQATLRPFDAPQPLTELTYRTSNTGQQSVMGVHAQQRVRSLFGRPGVVSALFGYGGHAADGEYPGSRLRRMRQLWGRLRYTQDTWSLEVNNLHNRRYVGAHGGVQPQPGLPFESIYTRIGADVRNPDARRQTIRNDLALTARARLWPAFSEPLTASAYWTAQTFRYTNANQDSLDAKTNRFGGRVHQDLRLGVHAIRLLVEGWTDHLRHSRQSALPDSLGLARTQLHATVRDAFRAGAFDGMLEGGMHVTDAATFPGGAMSLGWQAGAVRLFGEASVAGQPVAWIEEQGFGRFLQAMSSVPDGRVMQGRIGFTAQWGPFDVTAFGFAHEVTQPLDLYETSVTDSVAARVASSPFRRAGVGGDIGWRREARRGFYLTAQPTLVQFLNDTDSPEHFRVRASLPRFFAHAQFGARYLLFNGDLDLDLSLQGRFWSEFRSRLLHPPTGLLIVPLADARVFGPSGTLDVVVKGGIRTATLFVAFDNVLSGTQVQAGTLIVPTYPLPERRFRFGVYWPIQN